MAWRTGMPPTEGEPARFGEDPSMETAYDWVTVAIFAGLIVLFLQRSVGPERDQMWPYFAASVACAVINQVGNKAIDDSSMVLHVVSVAGILAILGFIHYFLRPFGKLGD
jgi:hypothetical protein